MITGIFKNFGKGILYFFLFPILIIAIAVYGVVGIVLFVIQFIKMIILFFSGRNLNSDLEEDIQAKAILGELKLEEEKKEEKPLSLYPSDSPVYGSGYSSPLFEEPNKEEVVEDKEGEDNEY